MTSEASAKLVCSRSIVAIIPTPLPRTGCLSDRVLDTLEGHALLDAIEGRVDAESARRTRSKEFSFDDTWGNSTRYADFIKQRIVLMHEILKEDGSIFIHCDKSGAHIIRLILDQVFGEQNFQSEIIWSYKRWSNARKGLLPTHQNIYFYSKSKTFTFNTIYTDYSETTNIDDCWRMKTNSANRFLQSPH